MLYFMFEKYLNCKYYTETLTEYTFDSCEPTFYYELLFCYFYWLFL